MSFPTTHSAETSSSSYSCIHFTFSQIQFATKNFDESLIIGRGGFGKVYKGTITYGKVLLDAAIKRLESNSNQGAKEFWAEIDMLSKSKLTHLHLVSLIGYCNEEKEMILVYEYISNGTLEDHLHKTRTPLTWLQKLNICIGAARGLDYLHSDTGTKPRVIHRDVKSSNILLDDNWVAKISDFGLSKVGPKTQPSTYVTTKVKGTFGYLDPNYFNTGRLTRKSDVYAFGVVLFEVLCGKEAVDRSNDEDHCGLAAWAQDSIKEGRLKHIVDSSLRASISSKCLEKFALLAERCLHSRPKERPTMAQVVVALESILALQKGTSIPSNLYNHADFWIPDYLLLLGSVVKKPSHLPASPVIVFVNSKSGGQLGGELLISYRALLNKNQVFDLNEHAPDKVLQQLYLNIEKLKHDGDSLAPEIERKLRIIVAGGDGTAGWILGVISDLNLAQPPPVATVPLGTINNLPFAFGWGKKNPGTDLESVMMFLNQVKDAKEMKVDSWHVLMRMKYPGYEGACDPIAPLELPHSMHAVHRAEDEERYHTFRGGFWNYFSMGMDAQVSYGFHVERKLHPEKFKNQAVNLSAYTKITTSQGWFWPSLSHPSSWNIAQLAKVWIMRKPGYWEALSIPLTIRSIICLNLPSFSGGLNLWGIPSKRRRNMNGWTPPYVDDGFLEVVGFQNAWNGTVLKASSGQGTRLAQARGIRFEFYKGASDHTFMSMDGEPWKQPLPRENDTVMVEISCSGQVSILTTGTYPSISVNDPSTPRTFMDDDIDSDEEDAFEDMSEERRKFGAASSFRLPDAFDLSQLS